MIGSSKLNKKDIIKIRKLVNEGVSDSQIAREFIPESGLQVSREHIGAIRKGIRWNPDKRSFLMKSELNDLAHFKTSVGDVVIETQLGWLQTKTMEKWFFLTLVNDIEVNVPLDHLMDFKPSKREILKFHNRFVSLYL